MNSEQESHKQTYQELETVRSHLDKCQQELVQVRSRLREGVPIINSPMKKV